MNKIFKVIIIACILIFILSISGSLIYYFGFFRPGIEKAEIKLQEQKFQQEKDIQTQDSLDKALKESALSGCLDQAYKDYSNAFDNAKNNLLKSFQMINNSYDENWDAECAKLNLPPGSPLPIHIADKLTKEQDDLTEKAIESSDKAFAQIEKNYENVKADCFKLWQD